MKVGDQVYVNNGGEEGNFSGHGVVRHLARGSSTGELFYGVEGDWDGDGAPFTFDFEEGRVTRADENSDTSKSFHLFEAILDAADEAHPSSKRFYDELLECGLLHAQKQRDYGKPGDPFANVRSTSEFGIPGWIGAMVRLNDKVKRLQSLAKTGGLANESAIDSFRDIAVYALIALVLYGEDSA